MKKAYKIPKCRRWQMEVDYRESLDEASAQWLARFEAEVYALDMSPETFANEQLRKRLYDEANAAWRDIVGKSTEEMSSPKYSPTSYSRSDYLETDGRSSPEDRYIRHMERDLSTHDKIVCKACKQTLEASPKYFYRFNRSSYFHNVCKTCHCQKVMRSQLKKKERRADENC